MGHSVGDAQAAAGEEARVWPTPDPSLVRELEACNGNILDAYSADERLVCEHVSHEESIRSGGYGRRQLFELVQNAADAQSADKSGRIEVVLSDDALYCANEGKALTRVGLVALLHAYHSDKRGDEIGRFGLGFKSVLGVTDTPQIFSRSISIGFDAEWAHRQISSRVPSARAAPVLRLARQIDVSDQREHDPILDELCSWATTVVRLPLTGDCPWLVDDLARFPAEFLIIVPKVELVILRIEGEVKSKRVLRCARDSQNLELRNGEDRTPWRLFERACRPSREALEEIGAARARECVTVQWAVPLNRPQQVGKFWSYFPLQDETTLGGIVNAPWHVNDDRVTLLEGSQYNHELLDVVVDLVVESIEELTSDTDPGRHLDYLPARGREARNEADRILSERIPDQAAERPCLPDQHGVLRPAAVLEYPVHAVSARAMELWGGKYSVIP